MHRIMIRMAAVLLLLLLPPLALAGGLLGLIGTTEALPDPAEIIGLNPTLFEEEILIGGEEYTSFAFPMPESMDDFITRYSMLATQAGYVISEATMPQANGKTGPFAYCVSAGARKAYIVPDYMGCMLLMVNNEIEYAHMPTPVPTAPPTPASDPDATEQIIHRPGMHVEYRTVEVDCPSCVGGKCSTCNGTGTYRNYGVAVPCSRYCSACGGAGYIVQRQPVWVAD